MSLAPMPVNRTVDRTGDDRQAREGRAAALRIFSEVILADAGASDLVPNMDAAAARVAAGPAPEAFKDAFTTTFAALRAV